MGSGVLGQIILGFELIQCRPERFGPERGIYVALQVLITAHLYGQKIVPSCAALVDQHKVSFLP